MIGKLLKNQDGQAMVENAIVLPILLTIFFIFVGGGVWFGGYLIVGDVTHEVARKYAVTGDMAHSIQYGQKLFNKWNIGFAQPNPSITVSRSGHRVNARTIAQPKLKVPFITLPTIERKSSCMMEYVWRDRSAYD
jgi:hypothetical protein